MQTNSSFERSNKPQRNKSEQQKERKNKAHKPMRENSKRQWQETI